MQNENLNQLDKTWNVISTLVPYGFGWEASRCIDKLMEDFQIPFIIDNDPCKAGTFYKNIPVLNWEEARTRLGNKKIVITTRYRQYMKIKNALCQKNKIEYYDFCWIKEFIPEWYWKNKQACCLYTVDLTVSAKCDFKCVNCNMFMPYYKKDVYISFEQLMATVDAFFNVVDYVCYIGFIGGEPLLCDCLSQLIEYISRRYKNQVGNFTIHTNASIKPDSDLLETIKKNNVIIAVSDYGKESPCREQMLEVIDVYRNAGIYCDVRSTLEWKDVGFPNQPREYNKKEVKGHVKACSADWRGLNDEKFYFCNIAWSAEKAGLIELQEDDFIDLHKCAIEGESGKKKLLEYSYGAYPKGYMSFCRLCGGCGSDNTENVIPGKQINK